MSGWGESWAPGPQRVPDDGTPPAAPEAPRVGMQLPAPGSIQAKLLLLVGLVAVLGSGVNTWYGGHSMSTALTRATHADLLSRAERDAHGLEVVLDRVGAHARVLADLPTTLEVLRAGPPAPGAVGPAGIPGSERVLRTVMQVEPTCSAIRLVDEHGREVFALERRGNAPEPVDVSSRPSWSDVPIFRSASRGGRGSARTDRREGTVPTLLHATPVLEDGASRGVVILEVALESLTSHVAHGDDPSRGLVIDQDGDVVLAPSRGRDEAEGDAPHDVRTRVVAASSESAAGYFTEAGWIFSYAPVYFADQDPGRRWIVLRALPESMLEADVSAYRRTALQLMLALLLVLVAWATWVLRRTLVRPVDACLSAIEQVAAGDLTERIESTRDDEMGRIVTAVGGLVEHFSRVLGAISRTSSEVAVGSHEVATSSRELSENAHRSASSLEQMSSTMEEMAGQTRRNAVNAREAMDLAARTREEAEAGDEQMATMAESMREIDEASHNISRIIKVIDEIAFQTNLLALNASVEAARAGAHGKGFAVVAEEVRSLAERSAEAARETTDLIEGSVQKVEQGRRTAQKMEASLSGIVASISHSAELVAQIAVASQEQAEAITQLNLGLSHVDRITQDNTQAAEQMARAAQELERQAASVREAMSGFVLAPEVLADAPPWGGRGTQESIPAGFRPAQRSEAGTTTDESGGWGGTPDMASSEPSPGVPEVQPEALADGWGAANATETDRPDLSGWGGEPDEARTPAAADEIEPRHDLDDDEFGRY